MSLALASGLPLAAPGKPSELHNYYQMQQLCELNYQMLVTRDEEGNGTLLQYSCLENPMDGGAWWAAIHEVAKSWT